MEPLSADKAKIYFRKKVNANHPQDSNITFDFVLNEYPMNPNSGYCLTAANEQSIINDIITDNVVGTNFVSETLDYERINPTQKKQLSHKIIEIIQNSIQSKLSSAKIFPLYHFRKGYRIVFYDQSRKINNFEKEFHPLYEGHPNIQMLSKDGTWFKIMNPVKIGQLMKMFESSLKNNKIFGKQATFSNDLSSKLKSSPNKSKSLKKKKSGMNPTITLELLTKIPIKQSEKIKNNKRLEMQYTKAKEATVGIRRLEYAYNMKTGFIYNKNIFKQKIKTIQNWWRSIVRCYSEFYIITEIQSKYRGHMARVALFGTLRTIDEILPFLYCVDNMIVRNKIEYFFNQMSRKYAYLSIFHKLAGQIELIKKNIRGYIMRMRHLKEFNKHFISKCSMIKFICEVSTKEKIDKLQSTLRYHLMNNCDKVMFAYGYNVHPYLYYKLKYKRRTPLIYQRKIVKFNSFFKKFKLLKLKANKGIMNEFEYLRVILLRRPFNDLKLYDKEYIYRVKHEVLNKYITYLIKETKLQRKYFDRWKDNTTLLVKKEQCDRLNGIVAQIYIPHNFVNLAKYFDRWRKRVGLIYKIVSLFHKKKQSDNHLFIYSKNTQCLKDLFEDYNLLRPGQKEREVLNALHKWNGKKVKLRMRDEKMTTTIIKADDIRKRHLKSSSIKKLLAKCNANKREEIISRALLKKDVLEHNELEKYFGIWKSVCIQKVLASIFDKTFRKEKSVQLNKLFNWKNKSALLNKRDQIMKKTVESMDNYKLLQMYLSKYQKKSSQLKQIEASLSLLVGKISHKNEYILIKKYFDRWKVNSLMNRIMIQQHDKRMLFYLSKWNRYKRSVHSIGTLIQKKYRVESINLRKYFDKWRNYNVVYQKYIFPLYQTKTKLFERLLSKPIEKRRHANNSGVLEKLTVKANENKKNILSNLHDRILAKHWKAQEDQFNRWRRKRNEIASKEHLMRKRGSSLNSIFNALTMRYSTGNLQYYYNLWRRKSPYHLYNCMINAHKKDHQSLILHFIHWKKQVYKAKLNFASAKITNRVKRRNYMRKVGLGCNHIFLKRLIQAADLIQKRSNIKKIIYKNIFSAIKSNLNYKNQLKSLLKLSPIANRQFRLFFMKWKLQSRRIFLCKKRFFANIYRRIQTNNKKALLSNLVKKATKRNQMVKGGFFKKYKKAAGVYYIKCSYANLQVFFLYRQKKYLSKRKYRMLKYVINKINRKLLKHQSLKRFVKDWRLIIRFCLMMECLQKRVTCLINGKVSLRYGIRRWYFNS